MLGSLHVSYVAVIPHFGDARQKLFRKPSLKIAWARLDVHRCQGVHPLGAALGQVPGSVGPWVPLLWAHR